MSDETPPRPSAGPRSRRPWLIAAGVVGFLAVVGVAALVWYLNQPVAEEVSLESAVGDVGTTTTAASADTGGSDDGLDGTWTVDTSIGEFAFEDATSAFVGFRIDEVLATVGATTAVGRTPVVDGSLTLAAATVAEAVIEADVSAIVTNAPRRDRAVQRALNTDSFPTATFALTEPIDLGAVPVDGEAISATAIGELTINGTTQPIEMSLDAQLTGELIVIVGSVDIAFADWGISVPSAPIVASVEDHGILELQLFFTRS